MTTLQMPILHRHTNCRCHNQSTARSVLVQPHDQTTDKPTDEEEHRTDNTGLAKVAVQCSADTFEVDQSLVHRINICGENRYLPQAPKRWATL